MGPRVIPLLGKGNLSTSAAWLFPLNKEGFRQVGEVPPQLSLLPSCTPPACSRQGQYMLKKALFQARTVNVKGGCLCSQLSAAPIPLVGGGRRTPARRHQGGEALILLFLPAPG